MCCCGVMGFDCLSGQISHHGLPPENWWEARFPSLEQPAHPIRWVPDAGRVHCRRPCQCGVHTGTAPSAESWLLSVSSNPSVLLFLFLPCLCRAGGECGGEEGKGCSAPRVPGAGWSHSFLQSRYKILPSAPEQGELMLPLSQGHSQYLNNMSWCCLDGEDNLYHSEFTPASSRGLTFFCLQIEVGGKLKKPEMYFLYSCALSLGGSRNMAALM